MEVYPHDDRCTFASDLRTTQFRTEANGHGIAVLSSGAKIAVASLDDITRFRNGAYAFCAA